MKNAITEIFFAEERDEFYSIDFRILGVNLFISEGKMKSLRMAQCQIDPMYHRFFKISFT